MHSKFRTVFLARKFYEISTAAAQAGMSTALRLFGLLDILSYMPSSPSRRAPCSHNRLRRLVTKPHKISGLIAALFVLTILIAPHAWFAAAAQRVAPEEQEPTTNMREPDAVYVGTPYDIVSSMLQMAEIKQTDLIYDLGCGDARILVLAAQKYGARGVGYEIDPELVIRSRQNVSKNNVQDLVKIIQADIFTLDLENVDVMPLYLHPFMLSRLVPQIEKMKPGSRIVLHDYGLPERFRPDRTMTIVSNEDGAERRLMLYTLPLNRE